MAEVATAMIADIAEIRLLRTGMKNDVGLPFMDAQ
jgi:hypothetical protein